MDANRFEVDRRNHAGLGFCARLYSSGSTRHCTNAFRAPKDKVAGIGGDDQDLTSVEGDTKSDARCGPTGAEDEVVPSFVAEHHLHR